MPREAEGFVLRKDKHAAQAGIDAVGKSDVDDAVESTERDRGLCAIARQGPQAFALTTGKKDRDRIAHIGHEVRSRTGF